MRKLFIFCFTSLVIHEIKGAPSPQYSGENTDITADNLETIAEIFGTNGKQSNDGYSTGQSEDLNTNTDNYVEEQFPNDYVQQTDDLVEDKATVEVDTIYENCSDYTEEFGYECVPYYQCSNGTIITDGAGLIDIRNGFGSLTPEDSKCPGFLDVCCKDPDFIPPPPPPIIKYQPKCGRRNLNGLGARIQGFTESESQFGEWPHMCAVLHAKPAEQEAGYSGEPETVNLYQCGGSLIAPGVILTAAHCVDKFRQNPTELKIRCGEWDTQHQTEPYPHQDRNVKNFVIHPEFDGRNLQNDFAVLFTSEDFVLDQHIDTACLPDPNELFDGTTCFATGWGKDQFGAAGQYQVVLKEIDLPVVSHGECQDKLRSTRLGQKFKLDLSFLCAGGVNGKDTCKGDGGSPLVCPSKYDPNTYVQAGIVAWGIGCGEDGTPGVYADVAKASCWIDSAITCNYGDVSGSYNSYFGYTSDVCQAWMDGKIAELERKKVAAGNYGKIFQAMIDNYSKCSVTWEQPSAPLVTDLERDTDGYADNTVKSDDSYTNESPDMSVDIGADENERQVVADSGYVDPNEKLVDPAPGYVDPNEKLVDTEVDSYVDPNEKLVESDSGYVDPEKKTDSGYVNPNEKQVVSDSGYVDQNAKQVDPAPVTCGAPIQVDASYTGDSADLSKGTDDTKDDIADIANPY